MRAQTADATACSAGDAAGPGNGGGKDGGALAGSAQAGSVSGEGPVPRCGFCACCVPRARQRLKRAAAEKDRTRQQQQHRAARPELSGKAALFAQNDRPHGWKHEAFQPRAGSRRARLPDCACWCLLVPDDAC